MLKCNRVEKGNNNMYRKRLCAILVILVLSLSMCLPALAEGTHAEIFTLTPEEEAYLQTIKGDTLSFAATSELLYFEGADKVRHGMLLPLYELLEGQFGLHIETLKLGWEESFRRLDNQEVDFLGMAILNQERRDRYKTVNTLYYADMQLYTCKNGVLEDLTSLRGKRIGLLSGSALSHILETYISEEGSMCTYASVEQMFTALEKGEIDVASSSLALQGELYAYPTVTGALTVESIPTVQGLYCYNEKYYPLADIINRYLETRDGEAMVQAIAAGTYPCTMEMYRYYYAEEIAGLQARYQEILIWDERVLYPYSFKHDDRSDGLQVQIEQVFTDLTGIPVRVCGQKEFPGGMEQAREALRDGQILAIGGVYHSEIYAGGDFTYSSPLMMDLLGFYVTQDNKMTSLGQMQVGAPQYAHSYLNWDAFVGHDPVIYKTLREDITDDLLAGHLDAAFIGEMSVDYQYTVLQNYELKQFNNLSVPITVHMLYGKENTSFNNLMETSIVLNKVLNSQGWQVWSLNSQKGKFEALMLANQVNQMSTRYMVLLSAFAVVVVVFMVFFLYQMRKFALYDSQIRHMLLIQSDVDMIWINFHKKKIESKGDFPILRRYGIRVDQDLYDQLMGPFVDDLKNINAEGVEFRQTEAPLYFKGHESPIYIRRYTAKINEREIMSFLLDATVEKEREKELSTIANTDYLSQLMTRRATEQHLLKLVADQGDCDWQLFVLIFDIDNFKQVNDNYGHDIGDHVLVQMARTLQKYMGVNNTGRWGGEEFLATLCCANIETAIGVADNVLHDFAQTEFMVGSRATFRCTVSCGVARITSDMSYSQGIQFADKALYTAKRCGKNCVRAYCPEDVEESDEGDV